MMPTLTESQQSFYREFLMGRGNFDPADFGISVSKEEFTDQMVGEFSETFRDTLSFDELLLRPREALAFCDKVRMKYRYYDAPDDIILRVILNARKHPS